MNSAPKPRSLALHAFAVFAAAMTFVLVIAGALVTSNDAGLSIPDWPTAFGKFRVPPLTAGSAFEGSHRMIAGFVACLTVALAVWIWKRDGRRWMKWLGGAAVLAVIIQAILGGLGVIFYLPLALTVSHSLMAEIFFALMVSLAFFTSPRWRWDDVKGRALSAPSIQAVACGLNVLILGEITLGAIYRNEVQDMLGGRHSQIILGPWPHIVGSGVVLAGVFYLLGRILKIAGRDGRLLMAAISLSTLTVFQIFLGISVYALMLLTANAPQPLTPVVLATVAHVGLGSIVFVTSVVTTFCVYRFVARSPAPAPALAPHPALTEHLR